MTSIRFKWIGLWSCCWFVLLMSQSKVFSLITMNPNIRCVYIPACTWQWSHVSIQAYQIIDRSTVCSTDCPANDKKDIKAPWHYWPFLRGIHQSLVDSPHKGPVIRKAFPCHNVLMYLDIFLPRSSKGCPPEIICLHLNCSPQTGTINTLCGELEETLFPPVLPRGCWLFQFGLSQSQWS